MIAWMLYCAVASALVAIAGRCAEHTTRVARLPIRWIWVGALALTFALGALAPFRGAEAPAYVTGVPAVTSSIDALGLQVGIDAVERRLPPGAAPLVLVAWGIASALLIAIVVGVHLRLRAARRRWPIAELHGSRVRVSPDSGPLVIGVRHPEIVVPRWVLDRDDGDQRVIVAHEAEHARANDSLLLGGAVIAAALVPWNPAVWYMFSRLRLAVELDCDARILRRGVTSESYGSLLLDVATHASPLRFGAPALAPSPSHLHQRILAMHPTITKYAPIRAGMAAAVGAVALLIACEAEMPTASEIDALDVRAAEHGLSRLMTHVGDSDIVYIVDGRQWVRAEALELKGTDIASIEVVRDTAGPTKFVITTGDRGRLDVRATSLDVRATASDNVIDDRSHQTTLHLGGAQPLILIDGKRATPTELHSLDRDRIASIEVLKGSAARSLAGYSAAELANGVIKVVTK